MTLQRNRQPDAGCGTQHMMSDLVSPTNEWHQKRKTGGDSGGMEEGEDLWALCGSWVQQATVYRRFWENQGSLTMEGLLDDARDLLVILLQVQQIAFWKQRLYQLEVHSWVFTEEMTCLTFVLKYRSPPLPQSGWWWGQRRIKIANMFIVEAGGWVHGGSLCLLFFSFSWKTNIIKSKKKKKNQETRPKEAFVLCNSNGFIQQTYFFITHFNSSYFWLNTSLPHAKWIRRSFCPSEAYHLVGEERSAFVKR